MKKLTIEEARNANGGKWHQCGWCGIEYRKAADAEACADSCSDLFIARGWKPYYEKVSALKRKTLYI